MSKNGIFRNRSRSRAQEFTGCQSGIIHRSLGPMKWNDVIPVCCSTNPTSRTSFHHATHNVHALATRDRWPNVLIAVFGDVAMDKSSKPLSGPMATPCLTTVPTVSSFLTQQSLLRASWTCNRTTTSHVSPLLHNLLLGRYLSISRQHVSTVYKLLSKKNHGECWLLGFTDKRNKFDL